MHRVNARFFLRSYIILCGPDPIKFKILYTFWKLLFCIKLFSTCTYKKQEEIIVYKKCGTNYKQTRFSYKNSRKSRITGLASS